MNLWTGKPHRRLTGPKKFPGGAADWPAIQTWTPERVVELWTGGHSAHGSGAGFQYDIDKKITCTEEVSERRPTFSLPCGWLLL